MNSEYKKLGYFVVEKAFSSKELNKLESAVREFHKSWICDNSEFYNNEAVNSAYLTGGKYLERKQRLAIFQFVGSRKVMDILETLIPTRPAFMNTQLFFNPVNIDQKNYWHRDLQYIGKPVNEQKAILNANNVIHFRIPLKPERGLELVPESHLRWDSKEEFDVRTETNGRRCFEGLSTGKEVALNIGDLLVFSANMIHRGLYGLDRLAFDIIFCDSDPELIKYVGHDCLPSNEDLQKIENPSAFINTLSLKSD